MSQLLLEVEDKIAIIVYNLYTYINSLKSLKQQ